MALPIYCTFWYTNEYYATTGGTWRLRVGAFKFPSCSKLARDFEGNGKSDILWRDTSTGLVAAWLMNGASVVSGPLVGGAPSNWTIVGTGDFNGDGKSDILWREASGAVGIWFMDGASPTSQPIIGSAPPSWQIVGVGDFNGDEIGRAHV